MRELGLLRWGVIGVYSLSVAVLLFLVSSWETLGSLLYVLAIGLWAISPVAALVLFRRESVVIAIGAIVIGLVGLYLYWRAFFGPDMDPQSALVLIILPLYQWIAAAVVVIASFLFSAIVKRAND